VVTTALYSFYVNEHQAEVVITARAEKLESTSSTRRELFSGLLTTSGSDIWGVAGPSTTTPSTTTSTGCVAAAGTGTKASSARGSMSGSLMLAEVLGAVVGWVLW